MLIKVYKQPNRHAVRQIKQLATSVTYTNCGVFLSVFLISPAAFDTHERAKHCTALHVAQTIAPIAARTANLHFG